MKIVSKILFSIPLFSILLSNSCRKQELPQSGHTGANTFGCYLNGKFWVPTGGGPFGNSTAGGFFGDPAGKRNIFIEAFADPNYIHIYLKHATNVGTYLLNQTTDVWPNNIFPESYGAYYTNGQTDYFVTDALHTGSVTITFADTTTGIVAGTFEMQLFRQSTNEVISVTKGRFDYSTH